MEGKFAPLFGALIALILLVLYAVPVLNLTRQVWGCGAPDCDQVTPAPELINVVTTIGGLVAALVISNLAITRPGKNPAVIKLTANSGIWWQRSSVVFVGLYLATWLIVGALALVVGVMIHPGVNSTLSDIGTTWLGLAVAAGYAYFGLDPARNRNEHTDGS